MMKLQLCRCTFSHKETLYCSRLLSTKVEYILLAQTAKSGFVPHFGDLEVTYTFHLWLVGKRVVNFLLVLIELFSPALTVEAL